MPQYSSVCGCCSGSPYTSLVLLSRKRACRRSGAPRQRATLLARLDCPPRSGVCAPSRAWPGRACSACPARSSAQCGRRRVSGGAHNASAGAASPQPCLDGLHRVVLVVHGRRGARQMVDLVNLHAVGRASVSALQKSASRHPRVGVRRRSRPPPRAKDRPARRRRRSRRQRAAHGRPSVRVPRAEWAPRCRGEAAQSSACPGGAQRLRATP